MLPAWLQRDRFGEWFQLLHDLGEDTDGWIGRLVVGRDDEVSWIHLPHQKYDGIDSLARALEMRSIEGRQEPGKPHDMIPPPLPRRVSRAMKALVKKRAPARTMRGIDPAWRPDPARRQKPQASAWVVLSREETARAVEAAKRARISLNSMLLWAVHQAVQPWLEDSPLASCWMVPVNMRDALAHLPITTNRIAYVEVRLGPAATAAEVHETIRRLLSEGVQFTTWDAYQISGALGLLSRRRAERAYEAPPRRTGVFSNVGVWSAEGVDDDEAWVIGPPPNRGTPFTSAAVVYNGRLSLLALIHPSLRITQEETREIVAAFKGRLLGAT